MISGADSEFVKGRGPPYSPISEKGPHMIGLYMCRSYAGKSRGVRVWFFGFRGLTPQQQPGSYQGGEMMMKSVFWWRKPEHPEETTDLRQVALLMVTVRVIYRGGDNNNDISMKPTTGTKCPTLLRRGGNVLEEDPGR